jgi:hypothetical protein
MAEIFIDDKERRKIVLFWAWTCLTILHLWGFMLIISVTVFDRHNDSINAMFSTIGVGLLIIGLLLVSNNGLDLVRLLISTKLSIAGQTVEKTTTETTKVTPTSDTVVAKQGDENYEP